MLYISRWLQDFDIDVYWNQQNDYYPVFKTKGRKRSDLLINTGKEIYVIECKSSENKNLYDSFFQLLDYTISETEYYVNNHKCLVNGGYIIATEQSINGHLFNPKYDIKKSYEDFSEGRKWAVNNGELPIHEHSMTEQLCRMLWRGQLKFNIQYPIGVLLSDVLNDNTSCNPLVLMKQHNRGKKQYYKVIP